MSQSRSAVGRIGHSENLRVYSSPCERDGCKATLQEGYRKLGVDVHVTTEPPIIPPRYEPLDMRCPHGVLWFAEPTSEQIAQWAKDGVE